MFKGTKKAFARTPHNLFGSKSLEDHVIVGWTQNLESADAALQIISENVATFQKSWYNMFHDSNSFVMSFLNLYSPINDSILGTATPSSIPSSARSTTTLEITDESLQEYSVLCDEILIEIKPVLDDMVQVVQLRTKDAHEVVEIILKALKKRNHKKIDYDRYLNNLQKLHKSLDNKPISLLTEKEKTYLTKCEKEFDEAKMAFEEHDQKIKFTIPYLLSHFAEFLSPLTSYIYLKQLMVSNTVRAMLLQFAQSRQMAHLEPDSYSAIVSCWEDRYDSVAPLIEEGLKCIAEGELVKKGKGAHAIRSKASKSAHVVLDGTKSAAEKAKHIGHGSVRFTPEGMFENAVDPLKVMLQSLEVADESEQAPLTSGVRIHRTYSTPSSPVKTDYESSPNHDTTEQILAANNEFEVHHTPGNSETETPILLSSSAGDHISEYEGQTDPYANAHDKEYGAK
ncbi:hypothetical protein NADFUDRAFT_46342 [Nadsonia fulvescens var. elongata DSM 6958]|uniref:BAR domain-containing protein n=1 Tax=Nadsonia fulvescens var. elongata DSM 6958 TaxID=857566 RepID=A0A1E3PKH6_9ASCO|nr:hypothetical protein NADFUDRAFT_46342 [Nadsonia fulvescens var. elongata DSM 6958]